MLVSASSVDEGLAVVALVVEVTVVYLLDVALVIDDSVSMTGVPVAVDAVDMLDGMLPCVAQSHVFAITLLTKSFIDVNLKYSMSM
uniref:Uncharacterized protein n=1 Tax=Parascaris equorum TaxID=6256 RepID=A0A914R9D9_PAREQ